METSASVSVIGLGLMGRALARAFVDGGSAVTVWNRTPRPRLVPGAVHADSASAAFAASPLVVVCVADTAALTAVLDACQRVVSGRSLVNLTTSLPEEAVVVSQRVHSLGGRYLDGIIPSYPDLIGDAAGGLIYAGDEGVWRQHEATLRHLGGASWWVGPSVGAAAAIDIGAVIGLYHVAFAGFIEAAAYVRQHGVSLGDLVRASIPIAQVLAESIQWAADQIERDDYRTDMATVQVHRAGVDLAIDGMRPLGRLLEPVADVLARSSARGDGDQAFAATFRVFDRSAHP